MLIILQIPISDLRYFVDNSGRLERPAWPSPSTNEYVRNMGEVQLRPLGGFPGLDESLICNAKKLLRSQTHISTDGFRFKILYKRFFFDGTAAGKLEIGVACGSMNTESIESMLRRFLELRIFIKAKINKSIPLFELPVHLKQAYTNSTTRTQFNLPIDNWWIKVGDPLLLVRTTRQYSNERDRPLTMNLNIDQSKYQISNFRFKQKSQAFNVFQVYDEQRNYFSTKGNARSSNERLFRATLLRLYSERETLRYLLNQLANHKMEILLRSSNDIPNPLRDDLQSYLKLISRVLHRQAGVLNGVTQIDFIKHVISVEDTLFPGRSELFNQQIIRFNEIYDIRKNIGKNILNIYNMGTYNLNGPISIAAMGDNASGILIQNGSQTQEVDFVRIMLALQKLKSQISLDGDTEEQVVEIAKVSEAIKSAEEKNGKVMIERIKSFATWVLKRAESIGEKLIVEIAKAQMLPGA